MAAETHAEWERYIMWSARRNLDHLLAHPEDTAHRQWCDTWYDTYFDFRRDFEGYVTMAIEKPGYIPPPGKTGGFSYAI